MKRFMPTLFIVLVCSISIYSQINIDEIKNSLNNSLLGKTITKKSKDGTISEITFLGIVKNSYGETIYYIVKAFYKIPAARVYHGQSRIFFFDINKNYFGGYWVDMPQQLPYKLENNILYFRCENLKNKLQTSQIQIGKTLPKWLCPAPDDCFQLQY